MTRSAALLTFSAMAAGLALSGAALPSAAWAQIAPAAHGPVDITADQLEVKNDQCLASWRGDAEALQDTSRLRANVLNIYNRIMPKSAAASGATGAGTRSCGVLERMEADGDVYYVTPTQVVKGDHAVYTADNKTIVVTGDVVTTQGHNVIVGSKLVINTDTGQANMVSAVTGRGRPGRVRAVVYPNNTTGAAVLTPPPPRNHSQP